MSGQEFRVEKCAGLTVYHPIKKQAEVIQFPEPVWDQDLGYGRWNAA